MKTNKKIIIAVVVVSIVGCTALAINMKGSNKDSNKGLNIFESTSKMADIVKSVDSEEIDTKKEEAKVDTKEDKKETETKKEEVTSSGSTTSSETNTNTTNNTTNNTVAEPVAPTPAPQPQPTPTPAPSVPKEPEYVPEPEPVQPPAPSYICSTGYDKNLPCDYVNPNELGTAGILFKTLEDAIIWCDTNIDRTNIIHYSVAKTPVYNNSNQLVGYAVSNNSIYRK